MPKHSEALPLVTVLHPVFNRPEADCAAHALHPLDWRHLLAVQCKTGGRIRPVPESLTKSLGFLTKLLRYLRGGFIFLASS